ncbi:MAG: TIR domain-containing protein [Candidatus Brocadiaceae bacterium]|nr:TIR domain-containing protein [Candidatus Brocadiaceae bacterium]
MSDIFISYASEDNKKAGLLAEVLEEQGWSVWWDRKIPPGRPFADVIDEALKLSKCVVVLWSKNSILSHWVKTEASEGLKRKILLPALLDEVEIPLEFRLIQSVLLVDWQGGIHHPEVGRLVDVVERVLGISRKKATDETLKQENKETGLRLYPDEKIETKLVAIERIETEPIEQPPRKTKAEEVKKCKSKKQQDAATPSTAKKKIRLSLVLPVVMVSFIIVIVVMVFQLTYTVHTSKESLKTMIRDKGFYDRHWNNSASGFQNNYKLQNFGRVVYDHSSNLMWQQSGSNEMLIYKKTKLYIKRLNSDKYEGHNDWRLPTVEEAMTLMEPKKNGNLYVDSVFDQKQSKIWTSEPFNVSNTWSVYFGDGGPSSAWVVDFNNGYCSAGRYATSALYKSYVRAVR